MNIQILKKIIKEKGWGQADLARMAFVSRAAVSKWFHQGENTGWANVGTDTLARLADSLRINPGLLLARPIDWSGTSTRFLWDSLYPDMDSFVFALKKERPEAMARLVQVAGFSQARRLIGKKAISRFEKYKKYLKPARRKELEILWPLYISQK